MCAQHGKRRQVPRAYVSATRQPFREVHDLAFRYFAGVFGCRYDNLRSAVRQILRGKPRQETAETRVRRFPVAE